MNYEESLAKLFSLHQFGIKLGLDNIKNLLHHIGNPELSLKTIHIAGSNGKGSTASFIASILMEAGYKVGLYTSPHFIKFNERIRINGIEIKDDVVVKFINENSKYIDENSPTFFELTTALAFKHFAESKVDFAIIETGLGGRLDATNVVQSLASVITSISFEHTNILGDSLESISNEKAGIIKQNQKVFIGDLPKVANKVIVSKAKEQNSEYFEFGKHISISNYKGIVKIQGEEIAILNLSLLGEYQIKNASLAVLTIMNLFTKIKKEKFHDGLNNVIANSGIQGRYEIYNTEPKIIFDSAHNAEGIELFLGQFQKEEKQYLKRSSIYGAMKDKNVEDILKNLSKHFDNIYGTEIEYERSLKISELVEIGNSCGVKVISLESPVEFITDFLKTHKQEALVVLGSMYILGEIKTNLLNSAWH